MQKLFTTLALALAAFPQAPAGLTVLQATSKQVQLSWTAGQPAYVVERKSLGGDYSPLPSNTDPASNTYTDTSVAPYETYSYRIRARLSPATLSDPSNEITVGPPPVGLSLASPLVPAVTANGLTANSQFGARLRIALDSNGDPAIVYYIQSPQEDITKGFLEFVTWNRVTYAWNAPRKVVMTGDLLGAPVLARDPSTNTWAIAYGLAAGGARVALSRDNGETWFDNQVLDCADFTCGPPALAIADGKIHFAALRNPEGVRFLTGSVTTPPAEWTSQIISKPMGGAECLPPVDVAVDSANQPAVAFWSNTDTYNLILAIWRPGQSTQIAMDTAGYQTDDPGVELKFAGTSARLLAVARRTEEYFTRYDQNLWLLRDQGGAFSMPQNLPSDGEVTLGAPSLAVGSAGQISITATEVGGTGAGVRCGLMKLIDQPSESGPWQACSPIARDSQPFYDVNFPRAIYAPSDARYIIFTNTGADTQFPGVVVWRER